MRRRMVVHCHVTVWTSHTDLLTNRNSSSCCMLMSLDTATVPCDIIIHVDSIYTFIITLYLCNKCFLLWQTDWMSLVSALFFFIFMPYRVCSVLKRTPGRAASWIDEISVLLKANQLSCPLWLECLCDVTHLQTVTTSKEQLVQNSDEWTTVNSSPWNVQTSHFSTCWSETNIKKSSVAFRNTLVLDHNCKVWVWLELVLVSCISEINWYQLKTIIKMWSSFDAKCVKLNQQHVTSEGGQS